MDPNSGMLYTLGEYEAMTTPERDRLVMVEGPETLIRQASEAVHRDHKARAANRKKNKVARQSRRNNR